MKGRRTVARQSRRPSCSGRSSCRCVPCDRRLRRRADAATDAAPIIVQIIQALIRG